MNRILVCIEDSLLGLRIRRILTDRAIAFDLVKTPIKKEDLTRYDALILHSSYRLPGLYAFVEGLLVQHMIPIIFVSLNTMSNIFHRFSSHTDFVHIDEVKMDAELPLVLTMIEKSKQQFDDLKKENQLLVSKLKVEKAMAKCKKLLIEKGLTEEEAHQNILKKAMDDKISKYDACMRILSEN